MRILPIASDGWRFVLPAVVISVLLAITGSPLLISVAGIVALFACFSAFFFRDFNRPTPIDGNIIYSPADGRVLEITELKEGPYQGQILIRIFLSVFNGHVQRSPIQGKVMSAIHTPGLFLDARDPQAHVKNEQNEIVIETSHGRLVVTQIAGLIARRIVCWVKSGDTLNQGERFGLIRFGSQVDVVFPSSVKIRTKVGDVVTGGISILGQWR